jgi:hypothetical protein
VSDIQTKIIKISIVNAIPRNDCCHTQGIEFIGIIQKKKPKMVQPIRKSEEKQIMKKCIKNIDQYL